MLKVIGAVFVVLSCGMVGFMIARNYKQTIYELEQLLQGLDYMQAQLQYQKTPLPALCQNVAEHTAGRVRKTFTSFAKELDRHVSPDPSVCMASVIDATYDHLPQLHGLFMHLGQVLGKFDLEGQQKGIAAVYSEAKTKLDLLFLNKDSRLRGYQTLGLCAGAAVAILLL